MGGCVSGDDDDVMLASSSGSAWLTFVSNMLNSTTTNFQYITLNKLIYTILNNTACRLFTQSNTQQ